MISPKTKITLWLISLLLFPLILWLLPIDFFDNGQFIVCYSKRYFGIECLGCGLSRAIMHFHHLDFKTAFAFNRGVVFWYPVLVGIWLFWLEKGYQQLKTIS